jgi:uncharacterized membrane protein YphA (DoxX/SURF4 family)
MGTQAVQLEREVHAPIPLAGRWQLAIRVAFRFCFVYLGLYCLTTQIIIGLVPWPDFEDIPYLGALWPMRQIALWTAAHVFQIATPLVYTDNGSGDKMFDWASAFCQLVFAIVATAVWSVLDRRREDYSTLHKWFRLFLRFCLAGQLLTYGFDKVVPMQMPYPSLTRLLEPYGNFSPMGVIWASIGAAPGYETFAGCAEMLGGILLLVPRTVTLGAFVSLTVMVQVFTLNMTYDVPVKILSFHLILMSLFLLAPDMERLGNLFFLNRAAGPSTQPPLFATARSNRIALVAQLGFGVFLLGMNAYATRVQWREWGGEQPRSALYGIWNVNQLTIDGQIRSPLITDYDRWRRVVFQVPTRITFQRMDESFAGYGAKIDGKTLSLTKDGDKNWKATFLYQRSDPDRLVLDGDMDGHKVNMQLQLIDYKKFRLVSRGFHWVQEAPFNR